MKSLLTPISSLLYSFLEPSAFEHTGESQSDDDVFSRAFKEHNEGQPQNGASKAATGTTAPTNDELERWKAGMGRRNPVRAQYMTPRSSGSSLEQRQAFREVSPLPPLPTCVQEHSPERREMHHVRRSFDELSPSNESQDRNLFESPLAVLPTHNPRTSPILSEQVSLPAPSVYTAKVAAMPRRPGRKRKILTASSKAEKHAKFLERNRVAAGKCRREKKVRIDALTDRYQIVRDRNLALLEMRDELEGEVNRLKTLVGILPEGEGGVREQEAEDVWGESMGFGDGGENDDGGVSGSDVDMIIDVSGDENAEEREDDADLGIDQLTKDDEQVDMKIECPLPKT